MGALGPGMVLKIDQAELFGPVKQELQVVVPLLGGLALAGMLLYWLVAPLIRKLVISERETAEVNDRLRDVEERWRFALDSTGANTLVYRRKTVKSRKTGSMNTARWKTKNRGKVNPSCTARIFFFNTIGTRSPFGSSTHEISIEKSIALMMPSPNASWISDLIAIRLRQALISGIEAAPVKFRE